MAGEREVIACHTVEDWNEKLKAAKESKKLIVINFTGAWCPPCRAIAPAFGELAQNFLNVVFFKVDVDELSTVATDFKVMAMPTFIFMREGEIVDDVIGANACEIYRKVKMHSQAVAAA